LRITLVEHALDEGRPILGGAATTLYAIWTINTYTVAYDGSGNTGGSAPTDGSSPYNYNSTVTVLGAGSLVKTGYTFASWNTAANGSGTSYRPAGSFSITANTTLYAQWAPNTYLTELKDNGTGHKALTFTCAVPRSATFGASGGTQTASAGGVTYTVEASTDVVTWTNPVTLVAKADTYGSLPSLAGTAWQYGTFYAFDSLGGKGFMRRVISQLEASGEARMAHVRRCHRTQGGHNGA